jgi:hypothetical protein
VPEIIVGPLLRHVGPSDATIWVETDDACEVEILGSKERTFAIEGHHYAIVPVDGLDPDESHPYEVSLDGELAWPPRGYEFPRPTIRPIARGENLRLLFGSCRCSAPHHPPHTFQRWWHPKGRGIDALRTYALRMLEQPTAMWPDAMVMMGDQLYADQPPDNVKEIVAPREVHSDGPVEVLEDFEEYTVGYRDAWTHPVVRWLLSTMPTAMIFDDHEINDKWKTSQAWLDEHRATDWYGERVIGGIMAYLAYQHLGNLSAAELAEDELYGRIREVEDAGELLREWAENADQQAGHSRFSFYRDLGPARLMVLDSRAGRVLGEGERRIMSEDEWDWVTDHVDGDHRHLLMASSLPFLLTRGMHDIEAWSEAVTEGAWGKRFQGLGEKVRIGANLDHWACFQRSYREFEELMIDISTGKCGDPPDSILLFGGDVHHCWLTEASLPADAGPGHSKIWHTVCSGLRKELQASEQMVLRLGHTRLAAGIGKRLAATAKIQPPRLNWSEVSKPSYRNQIGTLEIADGEVGIRLEQVSGGWRNPTLVPVLERKLF